MFRQLVLKAFGGLVVKALLDFKKAIQSERETIRIFWERSSYFISFAIAVSAVLEHEIP